MFGSIKTATKHPVKFYRRFRKRFYDGPDWVDLPSYLSRPTGSGYKSPTLMLVAWCYAWYIRIFTIPGRMIVSVAFLIILYAAAVVDRECPLRLFAFILIAILAVDFCTGMIFRPVFRIRRKVPKRVRAGNMIKVDYTVTNLRRLPAWNVHLDPIHQQDWLRLEADIASVDVIPGGETVHISAYLQSNKRGEYVLKPSFASTSFPFGIIKWTCRNRKFQRVLVYPAFEPLNMVRLPISSRFRLCRM